jgi:cytoskeletal protein CcmA (bactofilin family)
MIWKKSEADEASAQAQSQSQSPPAPSPRGLPQATKEHALIGPTIDIKGNLSGDEDLLVEGQIEGKIELRQHGVTIGKSGRVKADIHGRTIVVQGEVHGNLYGEEQIILRQTSTVRGNLLAPRVTLEDGSNFKGSIDMTAGNAPATLVSQVSGVNAMATQTPQNEKAADKI